MPLNKYFTFKCTRIYRQCCPLEKETKVRFWHLVEAIRHWNPASRASHNLIERNLLFKAHLRIFSFWLSSECRTIQLFTIPRFPPSLRPRANRFNFLPHPRTSVRLRTHLPSISHRGISISAFPSIPCIHWNNSLSLPQDPEPDQREIPAASDECLPSLGRNVN